MGNILLFAGGLIGIALPYMRISEAAALRMKVVDRRLPGAIDLLALSMGAGLDFPGSVRQVVEKSGSPEDPVVEEFTLILQSLQLGRSRSQALEEFASRVPVDSVVEFVGSVVQAELRGNPVVDVLRIQAEVSRRKRTVRAEEAAAKAGVKMMGPLVLVFICILMLIISPIVMKLQASG
jgi:tight adherence protein C